LRSDPPRRASKITVNPRVVQFVEELNPKSISNITKSKETEISKDQEIPKVVKVDEVSNVMKQVKDHINNNKGKNHDQILLHLSELKKLMEVKEEPKEPREEEGKVCMRNEEGECFGCG
jgi:S-adenosylmethionine hydrolase